MNADQLDQLIARFFAGEASKEECTKLDAWRQASPKNEALFQESKNVWDSSAAQQPEQPFDIEKGWRELQLRLREQPPEMDGGRVITWPAKKSSQRFFLGVAASFLIGFFLLMFYQSGPRPTVLIAENGLLETTLPDGSTLHLRKGSQLSWFGDLHTGTREFTLSGQALFEVAKTGQSFLVHTEQGQVRVLGTVFSVRNYGDYTEVYVKEGRVAFHVKGVDKVVELDVGDVAKGRFKQGEINAGVSHLDFPSDSDRLAQHDRNNLAWLNGGIHFSAMPLQHVADELSAYYDQPIVLADDPSLNRIMLSGTFSEMELEKILEEISLTLQLKYQARAKGGYILSSK